MGYLKRSKEAAVAIARTKPDGRCKKHPKHKQSPGVCSLCLCEKLSQLSATSSSSRVTFSMGSPSSSSSLSAYSSSSCSSSSSPVHHYRHRYGNEGKGSLSFFFAGKNVLTKSRSLVFVPRTKGNNKEKIHDDTKKSGFLSKLLLRSKNKGIEEGLVRSRTTRERR